MSSRIRSSAHGEITRNWMEVKRIFSCYVLISTQIGQEEDVVESLKKNGVKEVYNVHGVYDIIAKIEAETIDEVKNILPKHHQGTLLHVLKCQS